MDIDRELRCPCVWGTMVVAHNIPILPSWFLLWRSLHRNYEAITNLPKKLQMRLHILCTAAHSSEFKDENKGDHGNTAECSRCFFPCSTLIIVRRRSSLRALESIFITQSTRHHETLLHPSHKEVPSVSAPTTLNSQPPLLKTKNFCHIEAIHNTVGQSLFNFPNNPFL